MHIFCNFFLGKYAFYQFNLLRWKELILQNSEEFICSISLILDNFVLVRGKRVQSLIRRMNVMCKLLYMILK